MLAERPLRITSPNPTELLRFIESREGPSKEKDMFYRAEEMGLGGRPTRMTCEVARQILETTHPHYVGFEYLSGVLVSKKRTYSSKSGNDVTVIQGRHVGQWDCHLFVAYPETKDIETFNLAFKQFSAGLGPGCFYSGSIGEINFDIVRNKIHVAYLQSSVKFKQALETGVFPDNLKRAYSSWTGCLIANVFDKAISLGIREITFPENKIISSLLQSKKMEQLANKFGFNKSSRTIEEGRVLFVNENSCN